MKRYLMKRHLMKRHLMKCRSREFYSHQAT